MEKIMFSQLYVCSQVENGSLSWWGGGGGGEEGGGGVCPDSKESVSLGRVSVLWGICLGGGGDGPLCPGGRFFCPRGVCPGGSLSRVVSVKELSVQLDLLCARGSLCGAGVFVIALRTSTKADGTLPTGMYSCFLAQNTRDRILCEVPRSINLSPTVWRLRFPFTSLTVIITQRMLTGETQAVGKAPQTKSIWGKVVVLNRKASQSKANISDSEQVHGEGVSNWTCLYRIGALWLYGPHVVAGGTSDNPCEQTDEHDWKKYIPANYVCGGGGG